GPGGAARPTPTARATWTFRPTGDGAYTVTNSATGALLGVDSTRIRDRAWGTVPTVTPRRGKSPAVGQQWFLIPDASPAGTFHLVNRYSGLVLGLSADPGRGAETVPVRTWTDTTHSAVGRGRTAAEQTLTLTPARG
uniref:RICIN domain-containing protein n=1 Tax=Streptomyces murinus TaxID=33900 RepID=UPI00142DDC3C